MLIEKRDRAIADQVELCQATRSAEFHVCNGPSREGDVCRERFAHRPDRPVIPSLIVLTAWWFLRQKEIVPFDNQFHPIPAHVGAEPIGAVILHAVSAFRCAGCFECEQRRKMCLANVASPIAGRAEGVGKPCFADRRLEIDPIVRHAMCER